LAGLKDIASCHGVSDEEKSFWHQKLMILGEMANFQKVNSLQKSTRVFWSFNVWVGIFEFDYF
jgi:hypothetical protein